METIAGCALVLLMTVGATNAQVSRKHEHFQNADVYYGWVTDNHGEKLRTFITRPKGISGNVPVINGID